MKQVSTFLSIEAIAFWIAALIHAGVLMDGYQHREAMIAESVIAGVLTAGMAPAVMRPRASRAVGLVRAGWGSRQIDASRNVEAAPDDELRTRPL